jgi:hypothetical protein
MNECTIKSAIIYKNKFILRTKTCGIIFLRRSANTAEIISQTSLRNTAYRVFKNKKTKTLQKNDLYSIDG